MLPILERSNLGHGCATVRVACHRLQERARNNTIVVQGRASEVLCGGKRRNLSRILWRPGSVSYYELRQRLTDSEPVRGTTDPPRVRLIQIDSAISFCAKGGS